LTFLVHLFCYASTYNNMFRYVAKWTNKKVKATYNLKLREYFLIYIGLKLNIFDFLVSEKNDG